MRLRPIVLALVVALLDCATLEPLPSNTCGNGVVDQGEDCDTFPNDPNDKKTARCTGASEGENACRLRCGVETDSGGRLECPDGWGCSVAGVCRAPSGRFGELGGPLSAGVTNLTVGDFDGDGRKDVVGTGPRTFDNSSRLRVHYFDDNGGLAQAIALPAQLVSPVVKDLDGDGRDDIAFGLTNIDGAGGLGVLNGLGDRTFLPAVFPSITLPNTAAVLTTVLQTRAEHLPNFDDTAAVIFVQDNKGTALKSIEDELGDGQSFRIPLPAGPASLVGRPVAARIFDEDPLSTCSEVVLAVATSPPSILVVSPCTVGALGIATWADKSPRMQTLPVPEALTSNGRGVLVADFDGDGHLDLLVDTVGGAYLTRGTGTGFRPMLKSKLPMPLAAGDLNGDGVSDFILTAATDAGFVNLIFLSTPPDQDAGADAGTDAGSDGGTDAGADAGADDGGIGDPAAFFATHTLAYSQQGQAWTDAVIGHFNDDAYPDVAVFVGAAPDVTVLSGSGRAFTATTVPTGAYVEKLTTGDFDGDGLDDIAIAQKSTLPLTSDLAIAYGRAVGGPEPSRVIGRLKDPRALASLPRDLGRSIHDLVVTTGTDPAAPDPSTAFTLLTGNGDRQTLAPLFLLDSKSKRALKDDASLKGKGLSRAWLPLSVSAGAFADPKRADVLTFALGVTGLRTAATMGPGGPPKGSATFISGAWTADANKNAQGGLNPPNEVRPLESMFSLVNEQTREVNVVTATGDLDNLPDGLAELLVGLPQAGNTLFVALKPGPNADQGKPLFVSGLEISPGAQVATIDLDKDGFLDLVVLFGKDSTTQLMVFLNDQTGGFVAGGIPIVIPPPPPDAIPLGAVRAFAPITLEGAPVFGSGKRTTALAVATDHGVLLATLREDKKSFEVRSLAQEIGKKVIINGTGIAAGDFNGDGVDDIAVADVGSIRVMLQVPARQRR